MLIGHDDGHDNAAIPDHTHTGSVTNTHTDPTIVHSTISRPNVYREDIYHHQYIYNAPWYIGASSSSLSLLQTKVHSYNTKKA